MKRRRNYFPSVLKLLTLAVTTLLSIPFPGVAQADTKCAPLIILERTTNRNRVWYEATPENVLAPISAKWEMIEKGPGHWEPLTSLEVKKAYGIKFLPAHESRDLEFYLVSVPKIIFQLKIDQHTNCPYASYDQKNGPEMNVQKIMLTMKKSILPTVSKAEFSGRSMNDDREIETEIAL